MSENVSPEDQKELSPKQHQAIACLVQGMALGEIAKQVDIDDRTLYRWRLLPTFQAELRVAENLLFDESISMLKRTMKDAIICLARNMDPKSAAPYVQVAAASKLLDAGVEVHKITELESKISIFESLVKEAGLK